MFELNHREVHIWKAHLEPTKNVLRQYARLLSDTERERATALRFEENRNRWIIARATLRQLLGHYLQTTPESIALGSHANGKPHIVAASGIEFNLSHSAELAIFAFCQQPVGIDVEKKRLIPDATELSLRYFSDDRQLLVKESNPRERSTAFLRCWTRKEALLKASGSGLSDLASSPTEFSQEWTTTELDVGEYYVAAIAMRPSFECLAMRTWTFTLTPSSLH
jgi:4'-phosphopantetheinyl transferase